MLFAVCTRVSAFIFFGSESLSKKSLFQRPIFKLTYKKSAKLLKILFCGRGVRIWNRDAHQHCVPYLRTSHLCPGSNLLPQPALHSVVLGVTLISASASGPSEDLPLCASAFKALLRLLRMAGSALHCSAATQISLQGKATMAPSSASLRQPHPPL